MPAWILKPQSVTGLQLTMNEPAKVAEIALCGEYLRSLVDQRELLPESLSHVPDGLRPR